MKWRWAGWIVALLILESVARGADQEAKAPTDEEKRTKILAHSLFFPGLGQFHEKRYVKAAVFATAEAVCLVQAFLANKNGNDSYWMYRFAASSEDAVKYRRQTERFDKKRNAYLLAGAGVWIANMVDAFFLAKRKYPKKAALSVQPVIDHEKNQAGLHFCLSF